MGYPVIVLYCYSSCLACDMDTIVIDLLQATDFNCQMAGGKSDTIDIWCQLLKNKHASEIS